MKRVDVTGKMKTAAKKRLQKFMISGLTVATLLGAIAPSIQAKQIDQQGLIRLAAEDLISLLSNDSGISPLAEPSIGPLEKIVITQSGQQPALSNTYPSVSEDGRFVAFASASNGIVPEDMNGVSDVFVYDRETKTTEIVSDLSANLWNNPSYNPVISLDGRYVIYAATNVYLADDVLPPIEPRNLFLYDRETKETKRVANGVIGNDSSPMGSYAISANGRYIAFYSYAANGVQDDLNGNWDLFLEDLWLGSTKRITSNPYASMLGSAPDHSALSMSPDGRYIAFESDQNNLVIGDTNNKTDVFVYDADKGETERVSVNSGGKQGDGRSFSPSISANGRFVAFASDSGNFSGENPSGWSAIYVHDRLSKATELRSSSSAAEPGDKSDPVLSADGRYLMYTQAKFDRSPVDVIVNDRVTGLSKVLSVGPEGEPANGDSRFPFITSNGRFVAFASMARNLTENPTTGDYYDIYFSEMTTAGGELPAWPDGSGLTSVQSGGKYALLTWPTAVFANSESKPVYRLYSTLRGTKKLQAVTDKTSYLVRGLDYETDYGFEVTAGNADTYRFMEVPLTTQVRTGLPDDTPPRKPSDFTVSKHTGGFTVTWKDPNDVDLSGLTVSWKKVGAKKFAKLPQISPGIQKADIDGILNSQVYDIKIEAFDVEGNSSEAVILTEKASDGFRIERMSVSEDRIQSTTLPDNLLNSHFGREYNNSVDISDDGRFFVFSSEAKNMAEIQTINSSPPSIYLYDRVEDTIQAISRDHGGDRDIDDAPRLMPKISGNGRFVVFQSLTDIEISPPSILLYDRDPDEDGIFDDDPENPPRVIASKRRGTIYYTQPSITDDGSQILYRSEDHNDNGAANNLYLYKTFYEEDMRLQLPEAYYINPQISGNGQYLVVETEANIDPLDTNGISDIYLFHLPDLKATWISKEMTGGSNSQNNEPSISADGRYVVFMHSDSDSYGVYLYDRVTLSTRRIAYTDDAPSEHPQISGDGRIVVYNGNGSQIVSIDLETNTEQIISRSFNGVSGNNPSFAPAVNRDGSTMAFRSSSDNLVTGDSNFTDDFFYVLLGQSNEDVIPPTWPANSAITVIATDPHSVTLQWPSAEDNQGVTSYRLQYGSGQLQMVPGHSLTAVIDGLSPSTSYRFSLTAVDAAGNMSASSLSVDASTTAESDGNINLLYAKAYATLKYRNYIGIGDRLNILAAGDSGLKGEAVVAYVDQNGVERTTVVELTEQSGNQVARYVGSYLVAEGVTEIQSVEATLSNAEQHVTNNADMIPMKVGGNVRLLLEPSVAERLKGAYLLAGSANQRVNASTRLDGSAAIMLENLPPDNYEFSIVLPGGSQVMLNNSRFTVEQGKTSEFPVSGRLPVVLHLQISAQGGEIWDADLSVVGPNDGAVYQRVSVNGPDGYKLDGYHEGDRLIIDVRPRRPDFLPAHFEYEVNDSWDQAFNLSMEKRPTVTLHGQVKNSLGEPISGAVVLSNQQVESWYVSNKATTNVDGFYSLPLYEGFTDISISAEDFRTNNYRVNLLRGDDLPRNYVLEKTKETEVRLNIYTKAPGGDWIGPMDLDWRILAHFRFQAKLPQKNNGVHDENTMTFYAIPGENIQLCVDGIEAGFPAACGDAIADPTKVSTIEIRLEQFDMQVQGQLSGISSETAVSGILYAVEPDGKRRMVNSRMFRSDYRFSIEKPGKYFMYFSTASGYSANETFDIAPRQTKNLGLIQLSPPGIYGGMPGNELRAVTPQTMPGGLLQLRTLYRNSGTVSTSDTRVLLNIPAGTSLVGNSVTVNGVPVSAVGSGSSYVIPLGEIGGQQDGVVTYLLRLEDSYNGRTVSVTQGMAYKLNGSEKVENFGEASANITQITLKAPNITGQKVITVYGIAPPGSNVTIMDGRLVLGFTQASPSGMWHATVRLTDKDVSSVHSLTAQAQSLPDNREIISEQVTVRYENDFVEITHANLSQQFERNVSFDPSKGTAVFPFVYVPGWGLVVNLGFSNAARVSNVRVGIGNSGAPMGPIGGESYSGYVNPSVPGAIQVEYDVSRNLTVDTLPDADSKKNQLPSAFRNIQWSAPAVKASPQDPLNFSSNSKGTMKVKGKEAGVDIGIAFKPASYTPTANDLSNAQSTGISIYGLSFDYSEIGGTLSFQIKGYMPEDAFREVGGAVAIQQLSSILSTPANPQAKLIKVAAAPVKIIEMTVNGAMQLGWGLGEAFDDVSDGLENQGKLKQLEQIIDDVSSGCSPQQASKYRDWANKIANQFMAQEVAKWAMIGAGLFLGPETFGLGTIAMMMLTETIEAGLDSRIDKQIAALGKSIASNPDCEEKEKKRDIVADPKWIYDPSGFVYEVDPSNRIEGVTATAMYWDEAAEVWKVWDAEWYGQNNPLSTDMHGKYAWDVPEGKWKVIFSKEGYSQAQSDELTVLPPHTDVNVAMVSILPPQVKYAAAMPGGRIDVTFDRYVIRSAVNEDTLTVTTEGADGERVPVPGTVEAIDSVLYKGSWTARHYRFKPTLPIKVGVKLQLRIEQGVPGYNDMPLPETVIRSFIVPELAIHLQVSGEAAFGATREMALQWRNPDDPEFRTTRVKWKAAGDSDYRTLNVPVGDEFVLLNALKPDTSYQIVIQALYADGGTSERTLTARTAQEEAVPDLTQPLAVDDAAVSVTGTKATVTWKMPVESGDISEVTVEWKAADTDEEAYRESVGRDSVSHTLNGLKPHTKYQFTVTAWDSAGNRSPGVLLMATTGDQAPSDPGNPGSSGGAPMDQAGDLDIHKITALGGTIEAFKGNLRLHIPENAYHGPAEIRIGTTKNPSLPDDRLWFALSDVYSITERNGVVPAKPLRLDLSYDKTKLKGRDAQRLGIYLQDRHDPKLWRYVGGAVDKSLSRISVNIEEYGTYAVLLYDRTFPDILGHWSQVGLEVLISRHFIEGMGNNTFQPERKITRAEITRLLVSLLKGLRKVPPNGNAMTFQDVDSDAWYYESVMEASRMGLVQGDKGRFRPNDPVTREELAVLFGRVLGIVEEDPEAGNIPVRSFKDEQDISNWAREAMAIAVAKGLIQGSDDQKLHPKSFASRAQAAIMFYRLLGLLKLL
ncbi:MAG: fibronectin type III domain-containing protein [Candidatus Cohnella colombiensis]|uniref:Fibronectin type III domain-containing protein n=1 Tax=Candidatus Cohnella colombiensis TaxID=3121368 RepID=A0AA95EWS8_9BACL|nr:MAG: fibronectin type III domain-containing protein [Cohnella sp.]